MHHYAQLCLTQGIMWKQQEVLRDETQFWKSKNAVPNSRLAELEDRLQSYQNANTEVGALLARTQQELEEVRSQRDHHLKLSKVQADRLKELKEELEQMERTHEQMDLHIQALDKELAEVEEERDRYKQKWEAASTPTDAGSSATTTAAPLSEAASIVPQQPSTTPQSLKPQKPPAALDLGGMAKRLRVSKGAISNAKAKDREEPGHFKNYSRARDPDGIPWKFWEEKEPPYRPTK